MSEASTERHNDKKSLLASNTVHMAMLSVASWLGARHFKVHEDVLEGIALIGFALTVIFLRRSLIHLFDTRPKFEGEDAAERQPKPLYRSMTVVCALAMVAGWVATKFYYQDLMVGNVQASTGVIAVGLLGIVVFLRRGILHALG